MTGLGWTILASLFVAAAAAAGVITVERRVSRAVAAGISGQEQGLVRITAQVHSGIEQTLIGLIRELQLPKRAEDLRYGQLYLDLDGEDRRVLIRSRSPMNRGFLSAITLTPAQSRTDVTYSILRLPGDEQLHQAVIDLELRMIAALRRMDRTVNLQLAADALREFDRPRTFTTSTPSAPPAPREEP